MALTVTGVPEKISRADYNRIIESLGFELDDLRELVFGPKSITAIVLARNTNGQVYIEGDEVVEHHIAIPVED